MQRTELNFKNILASSRRKTKNTCKSTLQVFDYVGGTGKK